MMGKLAVAVLLRGDLRRRGRYVLLALATIVLGLIVRSSGGAIPPAARDKLGDALWAAMLAWCVGAVAPRASLAVRSVVTLTLCAAVELSQLYHSPGLDALRATTVGHLVLGSGFDPRDLAAYAAGVLMAAALESMSRFARHHNPISQ